jgi:hypothetical protein
MIWDTVRNDMLAWETRTPKQFQRELCALRLVNKSFYGPVTNILYSHGTFTFDVSSFCCSSIERQMRYSTNKVNRSHLARITGLRINLLLSGYPQLLEFLDRDTNAAVIGPDVRNHRGPDHRCPACP